MRGLTNVEIVPKNRWRPIGGKLASLFVDPARFFEDLGELVRLELLRGTLEQPSSSNRSVHAWLAATSAHSSPMGQGFQGFSGLRGFRTEELEDAQKKKRIT